ncbi:TatD family hydrolase [Algoriphagus sediminis]|uniref:TatD family hydrolase n=1 Tax=Algoriphagus sediminis TaxID=3057113 RepID=A0ABT7Y959_9BACT|nr:TatD family hydrolase [Algoriphagus sediminis]MDN3203035.1 TatD family hydrolase [Algoriphagus sediminis]
MTYIDTHAHIYSKKFQHDLHETMEEIKDAGVERIYMPNIDLESIPQMLQIEKDYPGLCIPMMGLHPCDVKEGWESVLEEMEPWFEKRKFAAVGEIGTDLYWDKTLFEAQKQALRVQIRWAKKFNLPIVLHCRDSIDETIVLVSQEFEAGLTGVFHCFTGDLAQAEKIIEMGFYLGIGGVATFKNGGLDKVIPHLSLDNLVLETDAPYLAPVPYRGKRNTPAYLPEIAQKVADFLEIPLKEVAESTRLNALKLFQEYEPELSKYG